MSARSVSMESDSGGFYDSDEYYESDASVKSIEEPKVVKKKPVKRKSVRFSAKKPEKIEKKVEKSDKVNKKIAKVEKRVDTDSHLKSSVIKKLVYCTGTQRVKPDTTDYVQKISKTYLKRVIGKIMELHSERKKKAVQMEDVLTVLKLSEEDLAKVPRVMCSTYSADNRDTDEDKKAIELKVKYYRSQKGKCLFIPKSIFKKMVKDMLVGCDVTLSKDIYDVLQASLESYIIDYIKKASALASHRNSKTLERKDFEAVKVIHKKI